MARMLVGARFFVFWGWGSVVGDVGVLCGDGARRCGGLMLKWMLGWQGRGSKRDSFRKGRGLRSE